MKFNLRQSLWLFYMLIYQPLAYHQEGSFEMFFLKKLLQ